MTLNWGPGNGEEITEIHGALVCNYGNKITDIPLTGTAGPQTWVIPSVGNATTPGGTTGPCFQNSFYVEYNGKLKGSIPFFPSSFGPVKCPTIFISPAANNSFTTTPGTSPTASTGASTGTGKSTSSSSGGKASPTDSGGDNGTSEPKTHVVIIVAIVAVLILALVAVVIVWRMRKQRRKRMEDAIMPWSSTNNNQFSKMSSSSMDDGHRTHAAAAAVGLNKSQPAVPQPTHDYHHDDGYAYNQYPHKQGYSDVGYNEGGYDNPEDEYYNPYYATGTPASTHPTYYSGRTPHHDAHAHANSSGYFPPPPPLNSNAHGGMGPASGAVSPALASTPLTTGTLVSSSSHLRGPQALVNTEPMSEMSNHSDKRGQRGSPQAIPMKVLSPGT
ncbi:hypothetical protein BGZ75_003056 [Mortierella antarctica]|nr:hypothetical protein BGZ67_006057 [Mortierella alpina]KAF9985384.1 hypothetical protein BGZ75_003056 [Mortierella antarctica]